MRSAVGRRLTNPNGFTISSIVKQTPLLIQSTSHFSSSSSSSSGRGRGRGTGFTDGNEGFTPAGRGQFGINREPEKPSESVGPRRDTSEPQSVGGYGHGRGRPIQSNPIPPAFAFSSRNDSPSIGRGRGSFGSDSVSPFAPEPPRQSSPPPRTQLSREEQPQSQPQPQLPKSLVFSKLQEAKEANSSSSPPQENIFNAFGSDPNQMNVPVSGAGQGNRYIRPPQQQQQRPQYQQQRPQQAQPPKAETQRPPQLSPEEAGRRARSQLSRGEPEGSGSGVRGRGGGGRGRGRGGRGRGRGRSGGEGWRGDDKKDEEAEKEAISIFVGDSADGEKFAQKMGPELMNELAQGFEDVCDRALPSTEHDALVDAYDTNLMFECEPEYIMPDFGSNPDIDEKPPMSLLECLEKVKPFIVAYEGIKDQKEWEEAIKEVMDHAPLIKEIVDDYSGPDRVTAKNQNQELDRIATTLPENAPDSVKRFADRAALTLKSNPGWGFYRKYQFMDKLVSQVSKSYK